MGDEQPQDAARTCPCDAERGGRIIAGRPDTIVTLVHGTFASHADWVQDNSLLASSISNDVGQFGSTAVTRFCWSGANTHSGRLKAGRGLRDHLLSTAADFPEARQFVIAHSHGGNVALYALKDEQRSKDKLRKTLAKSGGGVVTLATPFLHIRWRPLGKLISGLLVAATVVFALAVAVLIVGVAADEIDWKWWIALVIVAVGVPASAPIGVSSLTYRGSNVPRSTFLPFGDASRRRSECAQLELPDLGPDELLVIRPTADEASELLVSAQFLSFILARYLQGLEWIGRRLSGLRTFFVGAALLLVIGAGLISQAAQGRVSDVLNVITVIAVLIFLALGAAALPALVVMVAAAASFGHDGLFWPLYAQMTAEAAPVGKARVLRVDISLDVGLGHSEIYDDPDVIKAIVGHLNDEPFAPPTPT